MTEAHSSSLSEERTTSSVGNARSKSCDAPDSKASTTDKKTTEDARKDNRATAIAADDQKDVQAATDANLAAQKTVLANAAIQRHAVQSAATASEHAARVVDATVEKKRALEKATVTADCAASETTHTKPLAQIAAAASRGTVEPG